MTTLVTHVLSYAGPGSVQALLREGRKVLCHDPAFVDEIAAREFEQRHPGATALTMQSPDAIADHIAKTGVPLRAIVHNDVLANRPSPIEQISQAELMASFELLFLFPVRLTQLLLPIIRQHERASIVFVTSARYLRPEEGYAVATSIRAATSAFATSLAREVAAEGIQVNVVAPNYLASETYYPSARYVEDPAGRDYIRSQVPMGRLGGSEEIGELIAFLTSGKCNFVTGQVVNFTGGWP